MTNKGKKYLTKITGKQQKFIDLYTSKYGELSATDCAIKAGYDRDSAHVRAHELLDWRKNPEVVRIIEARQVGNKEVWLLDKVKHLANLHRIQQEAKAKGQYGVAGKMEGLKGKVQGFYVDRNLTITKELSESDITDQMHSIFKTREEFRASQESLEKEMFGEEKKVKEDKT